MNALKKIATGVAATGIAVAGLVGVAGTAGAVPLPASSVTVPGVVDVTLDGTVVKVEGKYVTIVLNGSGRKVVVELDGLSKVVGDVKANAKVKVVVSAVQALLNLVNAKVIKVVG